MGDRYQKKGSWISDTLARMFVLGGWLRGGKKLPSQRDTRRQLEPLPSSHPEELTHLSTFASLCIILFLSLVYVAWGLTVYHTVGMKWPPPWSFGEVKDLPASSEYSTETGARFQRSGQPERLKTPPPQPQHVMKEPARSVPGPTGE